MKLVERQQALDRFLPVFRNLWHPQPFREVRPDWSLASPALTERLLSLTDDEAARLNEDHIASIALLTDYFPELADHISLTNIPRCEVLPLKKHPVNWAWEIPGRKQLQIESFAKAIRSGDSSVIDWCGGKGHLGRLLALEWGAQVDTLELNAALCDDGLALAQRLGLNHRFVRADALSVKAWPRAGQHVVALHACGDLHRRLLQQSVSAGSAKIDIAPCCYYRGVEDQYQPLSGALNTQLLRDDLRLAVTETVTASPRLTRQRDKEMAWKLAFDTFQRMTFDGQYRPFKSVPAPWFRVEFSDFLKLMAAREDLPLPTPKVVKECEEKGWNRQREVIRLSIPRHAFRRALEIWLVTDLAVYLEANGYKARLGYFCERQLTPRNLLISAQADFSGNH